MIYLSPSPESEESDDENENVNMDTTPRCDGVTRRDLIRIGGLSALGLGLGDFFRLQNASAARASLAPNPRVQFLI